MSMDVQLALELMGKGMLGIFAVMLVIFAVICILNRVTGKKDDPKS